MILFQPEVEKYAETGFTVKQPFAWMEHTQPSIEDWAAVAVLEKTL